MSGGGNHLYFWLGASADADTRASHRAVPSRPCGECPLREAIEGLRDKILDIDLDATAKHLDDLYDTVSCIVGEPL